MHGLALGTRQPSHTVSNPSLVVAGLFVAFWTCHPGSSKCSGPHCFSFARISLYLTNVLD